MSVKTTNAIIGHVNNSHDLRKYGAPVYVRIDDLTKEKILIKGANVDDPNRPDDEHSRIIAEMAMVAFITGKQLEVDFDSFHNNELLAKNVSIV